MDERGRMISHSSDTERPDAQLLAARIFWGSNPQVDIPLWENNSHSETRNPKVHQGAARDKSSAETGSITRTETIGAGQKQAGLKPENQSKTKHRKSGMSTKQSGNKWMPSRDLNSMTHRCPKLADAICANESQVQQIVLIVTMTQGLHFVNPGLFLDVAIISDPDTCCVCNYWKK